MAVETYPEAEAFASAVATQDEDTGILRDRRRHSFHSSRKLSCDFQDADAVFIRVCTWQCWYGLPDTVCLI
jgi:adiponectin receptor